MTVPLAAVGVVVSLLVAQSYFGFMRLLGLISLTGIVINNAIVLLDRIAIGIRDDRREPPAAIIEGGL